MYKIAINAGIADHQLEADEATSLLDAALLSGVAVSYSCKRGDCGQCVATRQSGVVSVLNPARPAERGEEVFLCNVSARSDLKLKLPYFPELADKPSLRSPAKIHGLDLLRQDVVELTLRLPPSIDFRFLPGQFIRIMKGQDLIRSYSLSAGPDTSKLLRMQIKRVEGGLFSDYLFRNAKVGDLLQIEGPQGHFFVRDRGGYRKTFFLATGTGIGPVFAILSSLSSEQRSQLGQIRVYWGNREPEEEYLRGPLLDLCRQQGFGYEALYSRHAGLAFRRHVQDLLLHQHPQLDGCAVFACGNPAMIESARAICAERGLASEDFHADAFTQS